jgi:outer membrane protein OmpA-like peptidoglycan-associated protein
MRLLLKLCASALLFTSSAAIAVSPWIVFFDANSVEISPQTAAILDNVATAYRSVGRRGFVLAGHTDRAGTSAANLHLARRRAEAVRAALVSRGIPMRAFELEQWGEERTLVETEDGVREPQNRRVEIVITCIEQPTQFEYMRCRN